jgi:nitrogen regulatory protein PII
MSEYGAAEKKFDYGSKSKKINDVKKSLNNYLNQLKIHFDVNDEDILNIVESIQKSRKKSNFKNQWWHIWK